MLFVAYRRICPPPDELVNRLSKVQIDFQERVDVASKQSFFTHDTGFVFERLLLTAEAGYLSGAVTSILNLAASTTSSSSYKLLMSTCLSGWM